MEQLLPGGWRSIPAAAARTAAAGRRTPDANVNGIAPVHLVGHLTDVATAAGTVTVDRETWHWCAPEELADEVDQCPNDYKATDPDPGRLTTYRLAPGAKILVLEDQTSVDHPATLAGLAERLRTEGSVRVVVRLADDGTATGIGEVFTP